MKAGTAEKLVLNMISTATMIRLDRVRGNRMVDLQLKCDKLRERAELLVAKEAGVPRDRARQVLDECGGSVREALRRLGAG
jgi:N-acetylmuramic acid 6-phosphate etherase